MPNTIARREVAMSDSDLLDLEVEDPDEFGPLGNKKPCSCGSNCSEMSSVVKCKAP